MNNDIKNKKKILHPKMTKDNAPDLSDLQRFPVEKVRFKTISWVVEDIIDNGLEILHHGVHTTDPEGLIKAHKECAESLMMAYNYLDRWVSSKVTELENSPF